MRVTVCQLDNRLPQRQEMLAALSTHIEQEQADLLLLPEMCFHEWLAANKDPDREQWLSAIHSHARAIHEFGNLGVNAVIGTRPIVNDTDSCRNQAFIWTTEPRVFPVHEKYYLPNEEGYWEANWYDRGEQEFKLCHALDIPIGIQICTEMWFFEWARHFARLGAELLCIPRATPHGSLHKWLAGGQVAAVCAGAYCLSSNIWTPPGSKADCGGLGWIISPEGDVLAQTSEDEPFASVEVDLEIARQSKFTYPRYVSE